MRKVTVRVWHGIVVSFLYWGYQMSCYQTGQQMVTYETARYHYWLRTHQHVCGYCGTVLEHAHDPLHNAGDCVRQFS